MLPPLRERFTFMPETEADGSPRIELIVGRRPVDDKNAESSEDEVESEEESSESEDESPKERRSRSKKKSVSPKEEKEGLSIQGR